MLGSLFLVGVGDVMCLQGITRYQYDLGPLGVKKYNLNYFVFLDIIEKIEEKHVFNNKLRNIEEKHALNNKLRNI